MARIIVTGGAGFLGRHLCREFVSNGHSLKIIDIKENPEFSTVIADVLDTERMLAEIKDADAVFHLASLIEAGESVTEPQKYVDVNISGTINVLEAMRLNHVPHFLFSSSAAIYGDPIRTPIQEDDRTLPVNPYGMTKLAMEGLLSSYVKAFGLTGTALRYFNLYGPEEHHQPETHAIPRFIDQLMHEQPVTIYGDGQHVRDFIYISDVVSAHIAALDYSFLHPAEYHYFNISSGSGESVLALIQSLADLLERQPNLEFQPPRLGDPLVLVANPAKAHRLLNWQAAVGLSEGLSKTVEYFRSRQ